MSAAANTGMPTPADAEAAWPADAVEVGVVVGAWGIKGWFKVQPFAADPQALFSSRRWHLRPPDNALAHRPGGLTASSATAYPALLRIMAVREHGDGVVAQAHDVDGRSAAEALRGARIFVGRSSFPTAGPDEYYWIDLLGLTVVNREGEALGSVVGLIDTGPHSVLRVAPGGGDVDAADAGPDQERLASERLIPFVAAYVDEVSLEQRRIVVDWGLDY